MKLINYPKYIDENVINHINSIINNDTTNDDDFDENVFNQWLIEKNVESKKNPSAYIRSCFKAELEKGTFHRVEIKVNYVPNIQPLINDMREKGICVMANDSAYLSVVWEYIINVVGVEIDKCVELNRKIYQYMKPTHTFEDYKIFLKNSKTLKPYNIDWDYVDKKAQELIDDWDAMLERMTSEVNDDDRETTKPNFLP